MSNRYKETHWLYSMTCKAPKIRLNFCAVRLDVLSPRYLLETNGFVSHSIDSNPQRSFFPGVRFVWKCFAFDLIQHSHWYPEKRITNYDKFGSQCSTHHTHTHADINLSAETCAIPYNGIHLSIDYQATRPQFASSVFPPTHLWLLTKLIPLFVR